MTCAGKLQDGLAIQDLCCQVVRSQGPHAAEYPDVALQVLTDHRKAASARMHLGEKLGFCWREPTAAVWSMC